jgi:hypothetical protein
MFNRIKIYKEQGLEKELRALDTIQDADNRLRELKQKVRTDTSRVTAYMIREDVLYCKKGKDKQGWEAVLPSCLEQRIFKYVHCTMGHMGVDV